MSKPIQHQMARLVWHANYSLKRSLSAVTNAAANAMPTPNPNYSGQGSMNKNWLHPPDALIHGRVEYTVKLLGDVPVDQAKGTEAIKGAVQILRFNLSVKKATGFKLQKVELHINVHGLNIVDAKTKMVMHKYPLHRISFCADDKTDKRLFAFIARKQATSQNGDTNQQHHCYVFLSDKLAEEITLTIGEAFDLAYRRFLESSGRDLELKKQLIVLRKRISDLEMENAELKDQLARQQRTISPPSLYQQDLVDIVSSIPSTQPSNTGHSWENFGELESNMVMTPPPVPNTPVPKWPPAGFTINQQSNGIGIGRELENLHVTELRDIFDQDFNPRAEEATHRENPFDNDNGGKNGNGANAEDYELAISAIDSSLADMRDGFSTGLSFGKDDFNGADLDSPHGITHIASAPNMGIETDQKTT